MDGHDATIIADMVERTAALRSLEFPQRIVGMDDLNKHVQKISCWQCHVLRTRAAERLEVTLPTDCC